MFTWRFTLLSGHQVMTGQLPALCDVGRDGTIQRCPERYSSHFHVCGTPYCELKSQHKTEIQGRRVYSLCFTLWYVCILGGAHCFSPSTPAPEQAASPFWLPTQYSVLCTDQVVNTYGMSDGPPNILVPGKSGMCSLRGSRLKPFSRTIRIG